MLKIFYILEFLIKTFLIFWHILIKNLIFKMESKNKGPPFADVIQLNTGIKQRIILKGAFDTTTLEELALDIARSHGI